MEIIHTSQYCKFYMLIEGCYQVFFSSWVIPRLFWSMSFLQHIAALFLPSWFSLYLYNQKRSCYFFKYYSQGLTQLYLWQIFMLFLHSSCIGIYPSFLIIPFSHSLYILCLSLIDVNAYFSGLSNYQLGLPLAWDASFWKYLHFDLNNSILLLSRWPL